MLLPRPSRAPPRSSDGRRIRHALASAPPPGCHRLRTSGRGFGRFPKEFSVASTPLGARRASSRCSSSSVSWRLPRVGPAARSPRARQSARQADPEGRSFDLAGQHGALARRPGQGRRDAGAAARASRQRVPGRKSRSARCCAPTSAPRRPPSRHRPDASARCAAACQSSASSPTARCARASTCAAAPTPKRRSAPSASASRGSATIAACSMPRSPPPTSIVSPRRPSWRRSRRSSAPRSTPAPCSRKASPRCAPTASRRCFGSPARRSASA